MRPVWEWAVGIGLSLLVLGWLVLRPLGGLVQREAQFDWQIVRMMWHAFVIGVIVGAAGLALVGWHWQFMHL